MKIKLAYFLGVCGIFVLSGCVVRSYSVTRDRIDQDLSSGNRGYIGGKVPAPENKERKSTRQMRIVEVELHSPIKFEQAPKNKPAREEAPVMIKTEARENQGNRGYIMQSETPEIAEPQTTGESGKTQAYKVEKGDTLQKISQKFYGTTKRWMKIYNANKDTLKSPSKIYPGRTINIPVEGLKEPKENLK